MSNYATLVPVLQGTTTLSLALFGGTALAINAIVIPALKQLDPIDQLRMWVAIFKRSMRLQTKLVLIGSLTGFATYYLTKQKAYLYSSLLLVFSLPFTKFLIAPKCNQKLLALNTKPTAEVDPQQVVDLIKKWDQLHFVRTITSIIGFVILLHHFRK